MLNINPYLHHHSKEYQPGDDVLKLAYSPQDCDIVHFIVQEQFHVNGTITILSVNNIFECLNIGHISPF
jgi:hypothetical protein